MVALAVQAAAPAAQAPAAAGGREPRRPAVEPEARGLQARGRADVDRLKDFTQQMVDQVFSFGELGFQEFETRST